MHASTLRAAAAAGLTAAALAAAAPSAFAVGGGVNPATNPLKFPGTTTTVEGWKLSSAGHATYVQVAPRWVMSSGHGPLVAGQTFNSPTGATSKVLDQVGVNSGGMDISISFLETAIPAPAGGFPKLLTEPLSADLLPTLPGYVLWAGSFGATARPVPSAGWARADGAPYAGSTALTLDGGDSGSAGLLYRTATAQPILAGFTKHANSFTPQWGGYTRIADPISNVPGVTQTSIEAWAKAQFAKHPEATPPAFATFSSAGIPLSGLKPPAPRNLTIASATPSSVGITWVAPTETRVPITGYRVRNLSTGATTTLAASARAHTFSGLAAGTTYTFSVKSYNANGESPVARRIVAVEVAGTPESQRVEPDTLTHKVRANPGAPQGLTVTTEKANGSDTLGDGGGRGGVDYCATAKWSAAAAPAGATITRYETKLGGQVLTPPRNADQQDISAVPGADGRFSVRRCGLSPAAVQSFSVRAFSDVNVGVAATASATTPSGAPVSTPFAAAPLTATPRVSSLPGYLDYCVEAKWTTPAPVAGWPVLGYRVLIHTTSYSYVEGFNEIGPGDRSKEICGLAAGRDYKVTLTTVYDAGGAGAEWKVAEQPFGAPQGTQVPKPTNLAVTANVSNNLGKVAYCLQADWDPPIDLEGYPVTAYSVLVYSTDYSYVHGINGVLPGHGRRHFEHCGLDPDEQYRVVVYANFDSHTGGSISSASSTGAAATPPGAPRGTAWTKPTGVTAVAARSGSDICVDTTWQAPAPVAGFPVESYGVLITTAGGNYVNATQLLPTSARSARLCGLPANRDLKAVVYASFTPNVVTTGEVLFTSPV